MAHDKKLTSMKRSKAESKSEVAMPTMGNAPAYPYGLQLNFENEEMKKLPMLKKLEVGDKVYVVGEGVVTKMSSRESKGSKEHNDMTIQIESVEISQDDTKEFKDGFSSKDK